MVLSSNNWCRGMPLEALISSPGIRLLCIERVLLMAQKKQAEAKAKLSGEDPSSYSNTEISLDSIVKSAHRRWRRWHRLLEI